MGPQRRHRAAASLSEAVRALLWRSIRESMPGAAEAQVRLAFIRTLYGKALARQLDLERPR